MATLVLDGCAGLVRQLDGMDSSGKMHHDLGELTSPQSNDVGCLRDLESGLFARGRTGAKPGTFLAKLDESAVYRSTDYAEGF